MQALSSIVRKEIEQQGPISFRRFVELALFHPKCGYYSSGKAGIGKRGDFYTAPSVHSSFGETISRFLAGAHSFLGEEKFGVLEFGASGGQLAFDILEALRKNSPDIYGHTDYIMNEISPPAVREAQKTLHKHRARVRWIDSPREIEQKSFRGVVIANEFLDSLPFHRLKSDGGRMKEVFLDACCEKFRETLRNPETGEVQEFSKRYFGEYGDGDEAEACLLAGKWLGEVERVLAAGFVLVVDYGFLAPELYSPDRRKGTFRCFHGHELVDDPYCRIGEQDITADVNFSELVRVGSAVGLDTVRYTTQGQFLADWGVLEILQRYWDHDSQADRLAIKTLLMPEFMGSRFKVLVQAKGLSEKERSDFYRDAPVRITSRAL